MNFDHADIDWINDAPILASIDKKNPFKIPENYFNVLTEQLNSQISIESSGLSQLTNFDTPKDYFEQLPLEIETRISLDKIKSIASKDGFTVPNGYFENLESKVISQISLKETPIKVKKNRLLPLWFNYAAAACVTVALGSVLLLNLRTNSLDAQMKKIPDQEIINYLQLNTDVGDTPAIIENLETANNSAEISTDVPTQELEKYINTTL